MLLLPLAATGAERDHLLRWIATPEPDVAGYRVYLAFDSMSYAEGLDFGYVSADQHGIASLLLGGLDASLDYYAVMTAYDEAGNESVFSNEIVIPALLCNPAGCGDGDPCTADACSGSACVNSPVPDGTACDDGDPGTIGDYCEQGLCVGIVPEPALCDAFGGDTDGDTLCDDHDPCAFFANSLPLVISGFSGIPDECLCGDFDGDGRHSSTDAAAINQCAAFLRFDCVSERDEVDGRIDGFFSSTDASLVGAVSAFSKPAYTLICARRPEGTCGGDTGVSCDLTLGGERVAGALALYTFSSGGGVDVPDEAQVLPGLDLTIGNLGAVTWLSGGGLSVDAATSITSSGPPTGLINALKATNAVTLEAWFQTDDLTQRGPARIVALTIDHHPNGGNLMLGQTNSGLNVRLRTTLTDKKGRPSLDSAQGTLSTGLVHVVFVRDASGTRSLYLDGVLASTDSLGGDFSNWSGVAGLRLANESMGTRPWLGELHLVAIYDRALDAAEVDQNFAAGPR